MSQYHKKSRLPLPHSFEQLSDQILTVDPSDESRQESTQLIAELEQLESLLAEIQSDRANLQRKSFRAQRKILSLLPFPEFISRHFQINNIQVTH